MKNLVIILSHCDTEGKIKTLQDKLEILDILGLDIMLLSHCPVSTNIQKQVNYFVYDRSNPLLLPLSSEKSRSVETWGQIDFRGELIGINSRLPDAGWAVFNKIIKAADLAIPLDYDYYSIINYDVDLKPSFIKELRDLDFDRDILLSWSKQDEEDGIMGKGPGLLFSILKKEAFSKIRQTISKEEYLETNEGREIIDGSVLKYEFAEEYWGHLTKPFSVSYTEEVSVSTVDTLSDKATSYSQVAGMDQPKGDLLFRIFFEGEHSAAGESIKVFIYHIEGTQRFKINGKKVIEVSSRHLEDNVKTISYLKPDGSEYFFDEERKRATDLLNVIHFPVGLTWPFEQKNAK